MLWNDACFLRRKRCDTEWIKSSLWLGGERHCGRCSRRRWGLKPFEYTFFVWCRNRCHTTCRISVWKLFWSSRTWTWMPPFSCSFLSTNLHFRPACAEPSFGQQDPPKASLSLSSWAVSHPSEATSLVPPYNDPTFLSSLRPLAASSTPFEASAAEPCNVSCAAPPISSSTYDT